MTFQRKQLGAAGEELATHFLVQKGYRILARNWKTKYGEIDIIVSDGSTLVIVEVKTKKDRSYGRAIEMITARKRQKLQMLAILAARYYNKVKYRIDIVTIDHLSGQSPTIEHYIAAC